MSEGSDDSERKLDVQDSSKEGATGDSVSPSASPRDKKTKLLTSDDETAVPASRGRPLRVQDLLVAGEVLYLRCRLRSQCRNSNTSFECAQIGDLVAANCCKNSLR